MKRLPSFLCVVLVPGIVAAETIYVDADAPPNGDGSSWERAFTDPQDALAVAEGGDEIRVAEGTYRPTGPNGDREATFQLITGVALRGGYAGFGEPDPNQRDIVLHKTILSGDLNGDDGPNFENNDENSYHVVTGSDPGRQPVLDGLVITGGNADGMEPHNFGGGMYAERGGTRLMNCIFRGNSAHYAGGMYNLGSPVLTNCLFTGNFATLLGGGMLSDYIGSPALTNCTFVGNKARVGGGLYNSSSTPVLNNCIFWSNRDHWGSGEYAQIITPEGFLVINYSCVQGWTGKLGGEGNIGDDPRFIDLENGNVRLQSGSPAVDTGDNSVVTVEKDLDGNPRIINKIVDMGVYESVCPTIRRLKVRCSGGKLKAKLKTKLPGGSVVMLTNEGGDVRTVYLGPNGKGVAKWKRQTGRREVCASGCSDVCKSADCP